MLKKVDTLGYNAFVEDLFKAVEKLESIRKIPQFIFVSGISHFSALKVREQIDSFKKLKPKISEIDFIIQSPGGSAHHAYKIIRTLREHFTNVNIIVPFWAKSAATLLSLGGSSIIMDEFGEFGPLDVQLLKEDEFPDEAQSGLIDEYSLKTIENRAIDLYQRMMLRLLDKNTDPTRIDIRIKKNILSEQLFKYVADLYEPLFKQVDPYKIGEKVRYLAIAEKYAERILQKYNSENLIESIRDFVDFMVHDCPDHGYIIDYSVLSIFLKNVKKSNEISDQYCESLRDLSIILLKNESEDFVGFFDKKVLENKIILDDTKDIKTKVKNGKVEKKKK
jgi:hypothetical protein